MSGLPRFTALTEDRGQHRAVTYLVPGGDDGVRHLARAFAEASAGAFPSSPPLEIVFASGPASDVSGLTGALLVSRFITAGSTDPADYDPYSLLRTNEDIFGLAHLAEADGAKVQSFGGGLITGAGD